MGRYTPEYTSSEVTHPRGANFESRFSPQCREVQTSRDVSRWRDLDEVFPELPCSLSVLQITKIKKTTAVRSRILSKLIFASCVGFGLNVSDRLSASCEELPVSAIALGLSQRNVGRDARTNWFEVMFWIFSSGCPKL